jgi:hypothetical protein
MNTAPSPRYVIRCLVHTADGRTVARDTPEYLGGAAWNTYDADAAHTVARELQWDTAPLADLIAPGDTVRYVVEAVPSTAPLFHAAFIALHRANADIDPETV